MSDYYVKKGSRYVRVTETLLTEQQAWGDAGLIASSAVRYCIGRMTYMPSVCADWLLSVWHLLPPSKQEIIKRDVEEAFDRDDRDRELNASYLALGWDCDRSQWERVRKLWAP